MRPAPFLFLLCCALPLALLGQAQQSGAIHCAVQAAAPLTDADRAFIAGDFAKAENLYSAQLTGPAAIANYSGAVRAQLEQNKLAEALATAKRAESTNSNSPQVQALIGDVLLRSGQIAEASAAYTKAVQINPCTARAQFGLGRLSEISSNRATAARKFAAAHALAPADPEIAAAFFADQPAAQHAAGLHALLASNPVLAPNTVRSLTDEVAILDQHKTCTVAQEFPTASIELTPLMFSGRIERSWALKVRLNDADSPLLELDSSVSGIVLNPKDAQKAGVHPINAGAAPAPPYTAFADRVRVGSIEYHDCPVRVVPANEVGGGDSLIGTDFFRDHLIHIDYVAKLMTLNPLPAPPGLSAPATATLTDQYIAPGEKDWSQVFISGANLLVPTLINKKGPYLFVLDTGVGHAVISPPVLASVLSKGRDATINLIGTSGSIVKVFPRDGGASTDVSNVRTPDGSLLPVLVPVKYPVYRFANNEYSDQIDAEQDPTTIHSSSTPALDTSGSVSFDISRKSNQIGIEASGLLGFSILQNYFLDLNYRDGLIKVQFDPNRRYQTRQTARTW